ncbi:uncharacterized protein MCAP_0864-like [Petaurus breviceps papuanus]|uniref:uncharacterized protein MCAP_0864-like n=1 Tax=Petaurus breviceps papuanus TaxID=3040969 RepID=UPI0036DF9BDC
MLQPPPLFADRGTSRPQQHQAAWTDRQQEGPTVPVSAGLARLANPRIQSQQYPGAPKNPLSCHLEVGTGVESSPDTRSRERNLRPSRRENPRYVTDCKHNYAFLPDTPHPHRSRRRRRSRVPFSHRCRKGAASNRSSTYWSRARSGALGRKSCRSQASAPPNRVGEFLKPCGSLVQVSGCELQTPFDPTLEAVNSPNNMQYFKKGADSVHTDHAGLLGKDKKAIQTEISKLQNTLLRKESSLRVMKSKLDSFRKQNDRQSSEIQSLQSHVKYLEEINASTKRISSLKDISIQYLERENWNLWGRITENKSIQSSQECTCVNEWDECQHDFLHKRKQMSIGDQKPFVFNWETKTTPNQYQTFINYLAILLSNTLIMVPATEEAVTKRIQEIITNEQSWIFKTDVLQSEIQLLTHQLEQLYQLYKEAVCHSSQTEKKLREQNKCHNFSKGKNATDDFFQRRRDLDKKEGESQWEEKKMKTWLTEELNEKCMKLEKGKSQQILLNIEPNLQNPTTLSLEEKVEKLKKELIEMKSSNQIMKTQLRRVTHLKDQTIEKIWKFFKMFERVKETAAQKVINLKTPDYNEQKSRKNIE